MKRNKFWIIIFGTCLLLLLAACGNSPENKNSGENSGIKTQEKKQMLLHMKGIISPVPEKFLKT